MLDFMHPTRTGRRLLGWGRQTRFDRADAAARYTFT
jgi:hypothetical protein